MAEEIKTHAHEHAHEAKSEVKTEVKTEAVPSEVVKKEVKTESAPEVVKKEERLGIVYIYTTNNNTLVHMTDLSGNTISRISGGMITKHSRLKSDPTIAMFVAKKAAEI